MGGVCGQVIPLEKPKRGDVLFCVAILPAAEVGFSDFYNQSPEFEQFLCNQSITSTEVEFVTVFEI
jgi:hypothetical protein